MKLDSRIVLGVLAVAGIALATWSGATGRPDAPTPDAADAAALPEGHPDISRAQAAAPTLSGVVRETIPGGGYTYARLETDEGEVWVAGPETDLAEGETVGLSGTMDMGSFTSPTLDRTFDRLVFTDRFLREGEDAAAPVGAFTGSVTQVIEASRYVYLEVESEDGTSWLAAPAMDVAAGDVVRWGGGTLMRDFHSPSLDRTFESILFVGQLSVDEG